MGGPMLAENLGNLADGGLPMSDPLGGAYRKRGAEQFTMAHFPEGKTDAVRRWMMQPDLIDAFLLEHRKPQHELRLWIASGGGTDTLDFACSVKYDAADGAVRTS